MPSAETSVPAYGTAGMALMATAAVGLLAAGAQRIKVARKATHGIKFSYSIQKDAYADLEFMNDVGCWQNLNYLSVHDAFSPHPTLRTNETWQQLHQSTEAICQTARQ